MQYFKVKKLRFTYGEHLPIVVDTRTGFPVADVVVYILTRLRINFAVNTIEQFCRVMQLLYCFLDSKGVDIAVRMKTEGFIFQDCEIDELYNLYRLRSVDFLSALPKNEKTTTKNKLTNLESVRRKVSKKSAVNEVLPSSVAIRLGYTRQYLVNLAMTLSNSLSVPQQIRNRLAQSSVELDRRFKALTPTVVDNPNASEGLSEKDWSLLREIISPDSKKIHGRTIM